ncbi:MAG: C45 family peptidase [Candidatus Amulumruptor caecigallinarius]|nr:C45 family peptidase [Candidatus Amulumruptor caecigallinarius]
MATAASAFMPVAAVACTSAIVAAHANPYGRPILWKHRDTSTIDNKVEYVKPQKGKYGYVALFNASDKKLEQAWIGMNDAGFAVMNTASYNIKDDNVPAKKMDKEGILMTKALQTCRTVEDFAKLLDEYPRPMGVEANFGVIDSTGNGAFFETNNHSYVRYNLSDEEDGVLVRTNYSHSGRKNEGYGFVREADAVCVLQPYIDEKNVTADVLTEVVSRSFYQDEKKKDFTYSMATDVPDVEFVPRYKSTATIAIEGCRPVENPDSVTPEFVKSQYVMWTGIGYPPVAEMRAVTCAPDGIDENLRGSLPSGHSPLGDKAKALRDEVFTVKSKNDIRVDISKLFNEDGTGYAQKSILRNRDVYKKGRIQRDKAIESK